MTPQEMTATNWGEEINKTIVLGLRRVQKDLENNQVDSACQVMTALGSMLQAAAAFIASPGKS